MFQPVTKTAAGLNANRLVFFVLFLIVKLESSSGRSGLGGLAGDPQSFLGAAVPNTFYLINCYLEIWFRIHLARYLQAGVIIRSKLFWESASSQQCRTQQHQAMAWYS